MPCGMPSYGGRDPYPTASAVYFVVSLVPVLTPTRTDHNGPAEDATDRQGILPPVQPQVRTVRAGAGRSDRDDRGQRAEDDTTFNVYSRHCGVGRARVETGHYFRGCRQSESVIIS